jgi:hypothetical protein
MIDMSGNHIWLINLSYKAYYWGSQVFLNYVTHHVEREYISCIAHQPPFQIFGKNQIYEVRHSKGNWLGKVIKLLTGYERLQASAFCYSLDC